MLAIDVICLANSRKYSGRCLAGLRIDGNGWVRPVSRESHGALLPRHYRLDDGTDAGVLDVVRLHFDHPAAEPGQPENWRITERPCQLVARPMSQEHVRVLAPHVVRRGSLLGNFADRVPVGDLVRWPNQPSLALVLPESVNWHVSTSQRGARQVRAEFSVDGRPYNLVVTDPVWEQRLSGMPVGSHLSAATGVHDDERLLLTISRGERFEGFHFKLVAAVAVMPRHWSAAFEIEGRAPREACVAERVRAAALFAPWGYRVKVSGTTRCGTGTSRTGRDRWSGRSA